MESRHFNQEQKMAILNSAAEIGVRQAAELAGVHYTSVYDWRRQLKSLGKHVFLNYKPSYPVRGIKQITPEQEKADLIPGMIILVLVPAKSGTSFVAKQ